MAAKAIVFEAILAIGILKHLIAKPSVVFFGNQNGHPSITIPLTIQSQ